MSNLNTELIPKKLRRQFQLFQSFIHRIKEFDELDDEVILYFLKVYIRNEEDKETFRRNNIAGSGRRLSDLANKIKSALEDLRYEEDQIKQNPSITNRQNQKTYTTSTAGIYIANKIGRLFPLSKVSINDRIKKGELKSEKIGNKNIIYQDDLDTFIELHGDSIRSIS